MPATKTKKKDPLIALMEYKMDIYGISHEEMALALRMRPATLYNRKNAPEELSAEELIKLAKKLNLEIVITGKRMECKQVTA